MLSLLAQLDLGEAIKLGPQQTGAPSAYDVLTGRISSFGSVAQKYGTIAAFLNLFIPLAFLASGLILLFLLIGGGFSIIASGGNAKAVEGGKNQITGAVLGFLVIFAAYWIIQIIQVITGVQIFNPTF